MEWYIQLFFILWMFILPILAIIGCILVPIVWFLIVPKIARKLTYKRFSNVSWHMIADDSGFAHLVCTKEQIPEGIVRTEKGWRFLPRPSWLRKKPRQRKKKGEKTPKEPKMSAADKAKAKHAEEMMLRKFVWQGKPFWFGYAGKVTSSNPATLAAIQQHESNNPSKFNLERIKKYIETLGQPHRKELLEMLTSLGAALTFKEITLIDPTLIKHLFPKMFTPSMIKAFGANREEYGKKIAGKQYGQLIFGGGILIGLIILGIVALIVLTK